MPALDGVVFIDPRHSEIDIVQAVGRAIRLADDKNVGTIVIPVFMSSDEDHEVILDDSPFKTVWWVVKALRLHDEELAEQLDSLRLGLGFRGASQRRPEKTSTSTCPPMSAPTSCGPSTPAWSAVSPHLGRSGSRRSCITWRTTTTAPARSWIARWTGGSSGRRCVNQRARASKLSRDRWERLDALPGWLWNGNDEKWDEGHRYLLKYIEISRSEDRPLWMWKHGSKSGLRVTTMTAVSAPSRRASTMTAMG